MLRLRYSIAISLLACLALACKGDDDGSIYGAEGEESPSTGITLGHATDGSEQSDADGNSGDGDGDGAAIKLDTLPDEAADDGTGHDDCFEDVDIVFVMDVSTTMGPFFDKLEAEIAAVHEALSAYDLPNPPTMAWSCSSTTSPWSTRALPIPTSTS